MIIKLVKKAAQSNKTETPDKSQLSNLLSLKLDRITILMDPPNEVEKNKIISAVNNYLPTFEGFSNTSKKNGYKYSGKLKLNSSKSQPFIQLISKDQSKPFFRMELNPTKIGQSGFMELHAALTTLMDSGLHYLHLHARISRLDIAIDIPEESLGININDFHFLPYEGLSRRDFSVGGRLETIYLGTPKGNQWRLYRKDKEQLKKKRKIPPTIRLERVLKNPSLKLADLASFSNLLISTES